jgi:hypothetical protein
MPNTNTIWYPRNEAKNTKYKNVIIKVELNSPLFFHERFIIPSEVEKDRQEQFNKNLLKPALNGVFS